MPGCPGIRWESSRSSYRHVRGCSSSVEFTTVIVAAGREARSRGVCFSLSGSYVESPPRSIFLAAADKDRLDQRLIYPRLTFTVARSTVKPECISVIAPESLMRARKLAPEYDETRPNVMRNSSVSARHSSTFVALPRSWRLPGRGRGKMDKRDIEIGNKRWREGTRSCTKEDESNGDG